jgi:hypothetical protein
MANEDTVLEEAMDNLKEAGQRIRATQGLMRSEGMTDGENYRDLPYASLYGARHDRSRILRGQASEGSLTGRRVGLHLGAIQDAFFDLALYGRGAV